MDHRSDSNGSENGGPMFAEDPNFGAAHRINYQEHLHVTAIDVDPKCVHMAYIQFTLLHIPVVIVHGNTLAMQKYKHWFTSRTSWAVGDGSSAERQALSRLMNSSRRRHQKRPRRSSLQTMSLSLARRKPNQSRSPGPLTQLTLFSEAGNHPCDCFVVLLSKLPAAKLK